MKRRYYLIIFLVGLIVRIGVAALQHSPGFMDAEYYFIWGKQLAQGDGFTENIIWNYLDDPTGIPHPSHGYWMPLTSILAALGIALSKSQTFTSAQVVFVLIGSLFPPLTAYLSFQLTRSRGSAILAGGIAILPAFYLPFMTTSDTFGIYAVLGTLFFIVITEPLSTRRYLAPFLLGVFAGLMHLSRADGIMWLGFAFLGVGCLDLQNRKKNATLSAYLEAFTFVSGGYLVIMAPWFLRNYSVHGSIMAPGSSRTLWITNYNELFIYPASQLTPEHWLSAGLGKILEARSWALKINLQRSIAEQGMIFLLPLILIGLWKYRKDFHVKLGVFIWGCTFLVMTLAFPYQGARGGFFHSSAALLGFLWTAAAMGLNTILEWTHQTLNWKLREPKIVFSLAILFFALVLSVFTVGGKVISRNGSPSQWEENQTTYRAVETELVKLGTQPSDIVLTVNSPGYFAYTNRSAISIPDGTPQTVLEVAEKYKASYLILEKDHPEGLDILFDEPTVPPNSLQYLTSIGTTHIFKIKSFSTVERE
jgi:hypothetical protein